jgi:DNA adenine methylase
MPRGKKNDLPRPFLKWAGGKTQLLPQFAALYPDARLVKRYLEPFVGSGAVFFHVKRILQPGVVVLADGNEEIINVYLAVQNHVEDVIGHLRVHQRFHSKDYYYRIRRGNPRRFSDPGRAARFIYLNKTCFNGLYRLNSRGQFNVPMGDYKKPAILDEENLRAVSASLRGVRLRTAHFAETLDYARSGDFIYFDPPYDPLSATSRFTSYTQSPFGDSEQEELARVFHELSDRGCFVMLSNNATTLTSRIYARFAMRTHRVSAKRSINSKGDRRGPIQEIVVLNYEPARAGKTLPSESDARVPPNAPADTTPFGKRGPISRRTPVVSQGN